MHWKRVIGTIGILIIVLAAVLVVVLKSYDFNSLKPKITQAAREATGRELVMGGDISLKIGLTPSLVVEDVSFQNAFWGTRPELAKVERFEVQVELIPLIRKNIVIKRLILIEPDILIETDSSGKSNLYFGTKKDERRKEPEKESSGKDVTGLPALAFNEVNILRGRFTYKDGRSGKAFLIYINKLTAYAASTESPVEIRLVGSYNNEPFEARGEVGQLAALTDTDKVWPLNLRAKVGETTLTTDGAIVDPLTQRGVDIGFSIKGNDLKDIEQLIGTELPIKGHFDISGRAKDISPKAYKISDLRVALADTDIRGYMDLDFAGKRPRLKANLSSKKIDLKPLMPNRAKKEAEKSSEEEVRRERIFPDDLLQFDVLRNLDADVKIASEELLLPQLAVDDINLNILLDEGQLTVKPIKALLGGGSLESHFSLSPQGKAVRLNTSLKIDHMEVGNMLKQLEVTEILDGNFDIEINLKSYGMSIAEIMANLNGDISTVMGNGRIANKYIDLIGADISSGIFRLFNPGREGGDYTEINCFVMRFDIINGLAESTAFVFDTSQMTVVGDGRIDLRTEKLDISLKPSPKKGAGKSTKVSLSLGELTKPFKLGGTLAKPSLAIDLTQAAISIGKAVGGIALFGPAGIAASLVSKGSGEGNPCLAALEAARTGIKAAEEKSEGVDIEAEKTAEDIKESIKDATETVKGIEKEFKKLFGK